MSSQDRIDISKAAKLYKTATENTSASSRTNISSAAENYKQGNSYNSEQNRTNVSVASENYKQTPAFTEYIQKKVLDFSDGIRSTIDQISTAETFEDTKTARSALESLKSSLEYIKFYITDECHSEVNSWLNSTLQTLEQDLSAYEGKKKEAKKMAPIYDMQSAYYNVPTSLVVKPVIALMDFAGVSDSNPVKACFHELEAHTEAILQAEAENDSYLSAGGRFASDAFRVILEAIPQLVAAFVTQGASAGTLSVDIASASATSAVKSAATQLFKDPSFWMGAIPSGAEAYLDAKEAGANIAERAIASITTGLLNGAIEVGGIGEGGMQTFVKSLNDVASDKTGATLIKKWVVSAIEEGLEENEQSIISSLIAKGTYSPSIPIFSLDDETAIINPLREARNFLLGTVVGGTLTAPTAISNGIGFYGASKTQKTTQSVSKTADAVVNSLQNGIELDNNSNGEFFSTGGEGTDGLANSGESVYTDYSNVDFEALNRYDSRTYANNGWVTVNRVLTGNELTKLYAQFADAQENGFRYPQDSNGDYLITVGDAYNDANKVVHIGGTNQNPIITQVAEIVPQKPGDMSWIREDYIRLEGEGYGYVDTRIAIEGNFGEGVLRTQSVSNFANYRQLQNMEVQGRSGADGTGDYQPRFDGGRNDSTNRAQNPENDYGRINETAQQDVSLPSNDGTGGIVAPSYTQNRQQLAAVLQQLGSLDALSAADKKAKIRADIIATAKQYGIDDGTVDAIAFIAERTGTRVVFVDEVLTHNGTPADAKFDRASNTIFVSKSAVAPVYAVVKHELTHAIAGTELYNRLVDFVKHSSQMKAVLQRISEKNGLEQLHFEDLVDSTIKQYEARGEVLDNDGATEEIVAKFVAEFLLNDQATVTELFKSRQNVFYKLLYNLRQWTKRATLDADTKKLRAAEQLFVRAMAERGKRYYKRGIADTESKIGVADKFSIGKTTDNGNIESYQTSPEVRRLPWKARKELYLDFIREQYRGRTAKFIRNGHVYYAKFDPKSVRKPLYGDNRSSLKSVNALVNTGAGGKVFDLVENASYVGSKENTKEHTNADYFDYFVKTVKIDGTVYNVMADVEKRYGKEGGYIYTLALKEKSGKSLHAQASQKAPVKMRVNDSPYDTSVAQSPTDVNSQFMQNGEKYSVGDSVDFEADIDDLVRTYGALESSPQDSRVITLPKSITGADRVSQTAQTVAGSVQSMPDAALPEFQRQLLDEAMSFDPMTNNRQKSFANAKIESLGLDGALQLWRDNQIEGGSAGANIKALGAELLKRYAQLKNHDAVMELSIGLITQSHNDAVSLQATRLIRDASPEWKVYQIRKVIENSNAQNAKQRAKKKSFADAEDLRQRIRRQEKLGAHPSVIEGLRRELNAIDGTLYLPRSAVESILNAQTPEELTQAYNDALITVAQQKTATWLDKWNQWRYLSMLANPRTHVRNITGNVMFAPVVMTKNYVKFSLESVFATKLEHRTTSLRIDKQYSDFVEQDYNEMKDALTGNGKLNPEDVISKHQRVYKTKPLEWLRKKSGDLLEAEDAAFLKFHYKRSLAQFLTANAVDIYNIDTETLNKARTYAAREALKATFRDNNKVATFLSKLSQQGKIANIAIESLVPFKKTPTNVMRRGIEYSPAGFVGMAIDLKKLQRGDGDVTLNDVLDKAASAITGTALLGLGMLLASMGVLTGNGSDKEKEKDWQSLQGSQNYAINIADEGSYTLDWAAPAALPLFVGAELYYALSEDGLSAGEMLEALMSITEPVVEMSMMQGIQNAIDSIQNGGNVISSFAVNLPMSYISQVLPTAGGQVARIIDDTRRENYVEQGAPFSDLQYKAQQAQGKIPFLESEKKPYVNQWGETESTGNIATRLFQNLISPGYWSSKRDDALDTEISRLYEATQDTKVLPSQGVKAFSYSGKEYTLTAEENTAYRQKLGTVSYKLLGQLTQSDTYAKMDDEQRAMAVVNVYDYARDYAKKTVVTGRGEEYGLSTRSENINEITSGRGEIADYLLFEYWDSHTEADKTADGKSISGSKKRKIKQQAKDFGYSSKDISYYLNFIY